jgi:hypothetical protein
VGKAAHLRRDHVQAPVLPGTCAVARPIVVRVSYAGGEANVPSLCKLRRRRQICDNAARITIHAACLRVRCTRATAST